ncbi:MAG: immunoglobulin-like domain-containing protein [Lachnospiraceae bacterium]
MKHQKLFSFLKVVIALAAVLNLLALFLFPDILSERISAFSLSSPSETSSTEETSESTISSDESTASEKSSVADSEDISTEDMTTQVSQYSIVIEKQALTYDGVGELNLLDGVYLSSSDGTIPNSTIFASIRTGDTLSKKIVDYSADTDQGQIHASCDLLLENYNGPSLQLPETFPTLDASQLDTLLASITASGSLRADDGYGNDITHAVTAAYNIDESNPAVAHYIFTVVNQFNDSFSATADVDLIQRPILTLTTDHAVVAQHSNFRPFSYIANAVDVDGTSLMEHVAIQGSVDTSVPGEYILTYTIYAPSGNLSAPKTLTVTVQ